MKINIKKIYLLLWSMTIFALLECPMPVSVNNEISYQDKIVHFFLFGIFSSLLFINLRDIRRIGIGLNFFISFFVTTVFAGVLELLQSFVPGRTVSFYDHLAGMLGAIIFLLIIYAYYRKKQAATPCLLRWLRRIH